MQVILLEKVVNLGGLGDVVKVKDGYARNYLLPQGKAKRATPESLAFSSSARFFSNSARLSGVALFALPSSRKSALSSRRRNRKLSRRHRKRVQSSRVSWSRSPRRQASTDTYSARSRISTSSRRSRGKGSRSSAR